MTASFVSADPRLPTPYDGRTPPLASVPVTVVILTKNESKNIARSIETTRWAQQQLVIDSGSSDDTVAIATAAGADVIVTEWRGFGPQRDWALNHEAVRHDWVYFVDADEWVSAPLAAEIAVAIEAGNVVAYWQHFRLVWEGQWIAHCGWYPSARITRLCHRDHARYTAEQMSEHPKIEGETGQLLNDIIDEDQKGLSAWLHKHVDYASLEAERRRSGVDGPSQDQNAIRTFLKDVIAPRIPARPAAQFAYMYLLRGGFKDGTAGLKFCFYHAWFQQVVADLQREIDENRSSR